MSRSFESSPRYTPRAEFREGEHQRADDRGVEQRGGQYRGGESLRSPISPNWWRERSQLPPPVSLHRFQPVGLGGVPPEVRGVPPYPKGSPASEEGVPSYSYNEGGALGGERNGGIYTNMCLFIYINDYIYMYRVNPSPAGIITSLRPSGVGEGTP